MSTLWCKRCGICIGMCPRGILEFDKNIKANIVPVIRASITGVDLSPRHYIIENLESNVY